MHGIVKRGFTLVELIVVIFLIGLMTTLVLVNLRPLAPKARRDQFFAQLNSLVQFGWQQALTSKRLTRVVFDIDNETVMLEQATEKKGAYEPVPTQYIQTTLEWPSNLEIQQFFIEGNEDELVTLRGRQERSTWFFIVPNGVTQAVTINIVDYNELDEKDEPQPFSLVLNPFSAQFRVYDTFQVP